jgi:glycosyltransferase involved in cell wall biosynthesis
MASIRVLHISPSFFPASAFGGPIVSTKRLCDELASIEGVIVSVLTTNTAGPGSRQVLEVGAAPIRIESGYDVRYCRKDFGADFSRELITTMSPAIREADLIHLTGVYSASTPPALWLCRKFRKPLVWSPRGSLQRWGRTRRRVAKRLWERVCATMIIPHRTVLHVTSAGEAAASGARFANIRRQVIPNGIDVPPFVQRFRSNNHPLKLMYLGRLDPIKGIENLLRAVVLARVPSWKLDVYGEGDPSYRATLERLVSELALSSRIRFVGQVSGAEKVQAFADADLCVVPSHSENFGIVVAEAMAHGVPVIASRGTPWAEIETRGSGLWVDNSAASLAAAIDFMADADRYAMGQAGRQWMLEAFSWPSIARSMAALYSMLLASAT